MEPLTKNPSDRTYKKELISYPSHILFSPSMKLFGDDEDIISFPELTDLLKSVGNQSEAERPEDWAQIKSYLSGIIAHIKAASKSLVDHF